MTTELATLVEYFEASEQATQAERAEGEKSRRYFDGNQLTSAEKAALKKRGQPAVVMNVIKRKINFLRGVERENLSDPKAEPRNQTPDENGADVATRTLRYAVKTGRYDRSRKRGWDNLIVEGVGGVKLQPKQTKNGVEFAHKVVRWDRMFRDPHSVEDDFSDARYLGEVQWMDRDEAVRLYGEEAAQVLDSTMGSAQVADTYDDKPRWGVWGDSKRKRVRIVQIYVKEADGWQFYEFTKGGLLKDGAPSWLNDEDDQPIHPYIWRSAYTEGETNVRYGEVRELVDPQDEYNKRRSKALHILSTKGVIATKGAVEDAEAARKELARPDYFLEIQNLGPDTKFEVNENLEIGAAQVTLMEQVRQEIDGMGPNASMQGKDPRALSGRAIERQQRGGMVEAGGLTDQIESMDEEVYRKTWLAIRQHWKAPMWVRVTDDEEAVEFIGLNQPIHNEYGFQVGVQNNVAEMDMDIIIDPAPRVVVPEAEEFAAFAQLSPTLVEMINNGQFELAKLTIEMIPSLRPARKRRLMAYIEGAQKQAQEQAQQAAQQAQQQMQQQMQMRAQEQQQNAQVQQQTDIQKAQIAAQASQQQQTPLDQAAQAATIRKTDAETERARAAAYQSVKDADRPAPQRASA